MTLQQDIEDIRASIRIGRYSNEASVSQGIVLRILHALGWQTFDTRIVCPEYPLSGRRVDFALCYPAGKPIAFIEVKQIGQSDGAERQLFEYAFHTGVPMAILTDGQEWNFFLPGEQGDYRERRVYKLDIVERDLEECVTRLERYLRYDNISSGKAIETARGDYRNVTKEREVLSTLPIAWNRLIEDEDEMLLEIIADKVENLCGFKPSPDVVASFLRAQDRYRLIPDRPSGEPLATKTSLPSLNVTNSEPPRREPTISTSQPIGFVLQGQNHPGRNACDVMISVFEALSALDPSFQERFTSLPKHGRTRRYLSRSSEDLYPGRPDLCREYSEQLRSGLWISTNHSKATIRRIIEIACDVAGLQFGSDLIVNIGD